MCGRFTLFHTAQEVAERFGANSLPPLEPRYNVAPTQDAAVVTEDGGRRLALYRWGLVPSWAENPAIGSRMINARLETLAEKPSFRTALQRRRCLVPADGFYEWKAADSPKDGKTPMYIHRRDGALFAFAGLWDEWLSPDGSPLRSCAIITRAPNAVAAAVHDRMPAILLEERESAWLDPKQRDADALTALLAPYPDELLEAYAVSRKVNSAKMDDPECILPA